MNNFTNSSNITNNASNTANSTTNSTINNSTNSNSMNTTNSTLPCFINYSNETECYCPKDYSGPRCMIPNLITCSMSYMQPDQCPQFNDDFYVSDYDGDPPCIFVNKDDVVIIKLNFFKKTLKPSQKF